MLTDLDDPDVLAAGYADRRLYLIGPRFYLTWWRLLKLLWAIIPAVAMGGAALGHALDNAPVGEIIGSVISTGITAILQVAFWVTLVFAVLERTSGTATLTDWDVDQLPEIRAKGAGRADLVASLIFVVLGVGALLWDRFRGFVRTDSEALPILTPDL